MDPFVREPKSYGYRVLPYLDDFLIALVPYGVVSSKGHSHDAKVCIKCLMRQLGIKRRETKGECEWSQVVEHLGVIID